MPTAGRWCSPWPPSPCSWSNATACPAFTLLPARHRPDRRCDEQDVVHLVAGHTYRTGHRTGGGPPAPRQYQGGWPRRLNPYPWRALDGGRHLSGRPGRHRQAPPWPGDVDMLRADLGSPTYQSIGVRLRSPRDFEEVPRRAMSSTPQLSVQVMRLSRTTGTRPASCGAAVRLIGYFVGGVMAVGACGRPHHPPRGQVVPGRAGSALRAIGFGGLSVVAAVLLEAMSPGDPGRLIGLAVTRPWPSTATTSPPAAHYSRRHGHRSWPWPARRPSPSGLVGGLTPALHAARRPVAEALRGSLAGSGRLPRHGCMAALASFGHGDVQ